MSNSGVVVHIDIILVVFDEISDKVLGLLGRMFHDLLHKLLTQDKVVVLVVADEAER